MNITRTSILSGITRTRDLPITPEQWAQYEAGAHIQNVMPHLSAGDREFILSGSSEEEWDDEFAEDEDDNMDADLNCGSRRPGQCDLAGTEYCDWSCPFHDEVFPPLQHNARDGASHKDSTDFQND